jgi:hypothetical protein
MNWKCCKKTIVDALYNYDLIDIRYKIIGCLGSMLIGSIIYIFDHSLEGLLYWCFGAIMPWPIIHVLVRTKEWYESYVTYREQRLH